MAEPITAYCMKDRQTVEIQNPEPVFTKAGRPATRGTCPKCGTTVYRMGATPAHEGMSPEAGKGK